MYSGLKKTELINYKDLLIAWTSRIIRARYQQSILGGLWAILQPVATVLIFTVVFSYFFKSGYGKYSLYCVFLYGNGSLVIFFNFN